MGQPAAKQGDELTATDIHIVLVPSVDGWPSLCRFRIVFAGAITAG